MAIKLTERAAKEVGRVMEEQEMNSSEYSLRVGVRGGGCSGFEYSLAFVKNEEINESEDQLLDFFGVQVVIDNKSELYIGGTEIDFYEGLEKRGFVFNNPQATSCCGCNKSFSV